MGEEKRGHRAASVAHDAPFSNPKDFHRAMPIMRSGRLTQPAQRARAARLGVRETTMSDDPQPDKTQADADLERAVRAERKFSLAEAIGRMAGPGAMKGASPVTRKRQAEAELQEYLARTAGYETNKFEISDADRAVVKQHWGDVIERYGYG